MKIFLFSCMVTILVLACYFGKIGSGFSDSIKDSKSKGFYVCEYYPHKIFINDTLQFRIREAWVEKHWSFGERGDVYEREGYQLIIRVEEDIFEKTDYAFSWLIGINWERNFYGCGNKCIITDFPEIPKDIETWEVQAGSKLDSISIKKIIGTMTLIKK